MIVRNRTSADERTITGRYRTAGYLGPWSSSITLAWLASHRGRLHTLLAGGKRISMLVIWDTRGAELVKRSEADVAAIDTLVNGEDARARTAVAAARADRDRYIRAFNRLEKAVTNHIRDCIDADALAHAHRAVMRDVTERAR